VTGPHERESDRGFEIGIPDPIGPSLIVTFYPSAQLEGSQSCPKRRAPALDSIAMLWCASGTAA